MPDYDFKSLSHHDFELLVASVLNREWGVHLEAFKSGRDRGIDLRYSKPNARYGEIVQCKHYAISGYAALLRSLKAELPKVRKLKPARYAVATSVSLTAKQKDDIKDLFEPFILTTGDIYGRIDLNLMLARHPEVEKENFKLWLTSTAVMERVLHSAEHCQTEFEVEKIISKLPLYVQSKAYLRATEILNLSNVVVISGAPGIGKSTLAEMLVYSFIDSGFEPIVIKSKLTEGRKRFKNTIPQIVYYDDFLGRTFYRDASGYHLKNEDSSLVDFIEQVQRSKNSKFVLTTREHILSNAIIGSEKLRHSPLIDHKCVLTLQDYSSFERAKILYNHIYFSKMPLAYKDKLLEHNFYLEILKHRNFNPRLIEWLSSYQRVKNITSDNYKTFVRGILDDPHEIWRDAFFSQISHSARSLLLFIYSMGGRAHILQCEFGWQLIHEHRSKKYNFEMPDEGISSALKEIEGSFVKIQSNNIDFINPSVIDFFHTLVLQSKNLLEDVIRSASYFAQIFYLWTVGSSDIGYPLRDVIKKNQAILLDAIKNTVRPQEDLESEYGYTTVRPVDTDAEVKMYGLITISNETQNIQIWNITKGYFNQLITSWNIGEVEYQNTASILRKIENITTGIIHNDKSLYQSLRNEFFARAQQCEDYGNFIQLEEYIEDANPPATVEENDVFNVAFMKYVSCRFSADLGALYRDGDSLNDLHEFLERMMQKRGFPIEEQLKSANDALMEYDLHQERSAEDYYDRWKEDRSDGNPDENSVEHLFQSLK